MDCEICGEREAEVVIDIEGAILNVCTQCARGAKIISRLKKHGNYKKEDLPGHKKYNHGVKIEQDIVNNYSEVILEGLKQMTLDVRTVAEKLNIKYSVLNNIAHGRLVPDLKLAHKLEKELNIKLVEDITVSSEAIKHTDDREVTLGDIVEVD